MKYSQTDQFVLNSPYFRVIQINRGCCEIQSRNTGHFWKLVDAGGGCCLRLYHKYPEDLKYHVQTHVATIEDAILEIALHDNYKIYGKNHLQYTRGTYTFYDYVLDQYKV